MTLSQAKLLPTGRLLALASAAILAAAACAPQAAAPTAVPAKPAPTAAPAQPAPTTAPAKPAATAAPAKPAPTAAPAKPAATAAPAAKPAEFDEKAVADFYKGKNVRIVAGQAPGGSTDNNARLLQKVLGKYIPGNPTVVVENKPGAGGMLAVNTVYASEPKDGTVVAAFDGQLILQQAIGSQGVQFDATKFYWLATTLSAPAACAVRTDSGINGIQEVIDGKEVTMSSFGKGSVSYDPPAVLNVALGTKFKIITGYDGGAPQRLAVKNKEVQGFCTSFDTLTSVARDMFEGSDPLTKIIIVTGAETPEHPFLKGVPAAEKLAKTDEARALLKAVDAPGQLTLAFMAAPEVPRDRVQALRRAFDKAYKDPEYLEAAQKGQLAVRPKTGEQANRMAEEIFSMPASTLAKLKDALK